MTVNTLVTTTLTSQSKDEYWLQEYICSNPECLGLGKLVVVGKERTQRGGGRLDILLKDIDDEAFYEIEVMLGETDESHIVRTIEYWDLEKKRWPKRQHTAVLVAEKINTRFYNVINLLSNAVPIIGIQVNAVSKPDGFDLIFTKMIDTYQEPEIDEEFTNKGQARELSEHVEMAHSFVLQILTDINKNITATKLKWGYSYFNTDGRVAKVIERGNARVTIEIDPTTPLEPLSEMATNANLVNDTKYDKIRLWIDTEAISKNIPVIDKIIRSAIPNLNK